MPTIPIGRSQISSIDSPLPTTGLSPGQAIDPLGKAIGDIGNTIGNIGEVIYKRVQVQQTEDKKIFALDYNTKIEKTALSFATRFEEEPDPEKQLGIFQEFTQFHKNTIDDKKNGLSLDNISPDTPMGKRMTQIGGFSEDELKLNQLQLSSKLEHYYLKYAGVAADARNTLIVQSGQDVTNTVTLGLMQGFYTPDEAKVAIASAFQGAKNAPVLIKNEIQRSTIDYLNNAFDKGDQGVINAFNKGVFNQDLLGAAGDKGQINIFRDKAKAAEEEIGVENLYTQMKAKHGYDFEAAMTEVREKKLPIKQQKSVLAILRTEKNDFDESNNQAKSLGKENDRNKIWGAINQKNNKYALQSTRKSEWLDEHEKSVIYNHIEKSSEAGGNEYKTNKKTYANIATDLSSDNPQYDVAKINSLRNNGLSNTDADKLVDRFNSMKSNPAKKRQVNLIFSQLKEDKKLREGMPGLSQDANDEEYNQEVIDFTEALKDPKTDPREYLDSVIKPRREAKIAEVIRASTKPGIFESIGNFFKSKPTENKIAPAESPITKTIRGKTYQKINGQWYEK